MKVLICIPVYNEENNIGAVLDELKATCPGYDILIIDDCSTDNSYAVSRSRGVSVIKLPSNLGIGGARQTGFRYAYYNNYDALVQLDGDGQHDPSYIDHMLPVLQQGYNICIGSRFIDRNGFQSSFMRRMGISFLYTLIKTFFKLSISDPTSGFRVCDKDAIRLFTFNYPQDYPEPESIVIAVRHRLRIREIPVKMKKRQSGKSSIGKSDSVYFLLKVTLAIIIDAMTDS